MSSYDLDLNGLDYHLNSILDASNKEQVGLPVWCIALMPTEGLDYLTYQNSVKIAKKMKHINDLGLTVWLRPMHEMNGDWYAWGNQPQKFKEKWKLLSKIIKSHTTRTYMLWSPNIAFGNSLDDPHGGYTSYFPSDDPDSIDIIGVSCYHWGKSSQRINVAPSATELISKLIILSKLYGHRSPYKKPIVISETAAVYSLDSDTHTPIQGGDSEYLIKLTWLHLLFDPYLKHAIPELKAAIWFEVVKDENATGNTPVRTEDFRLITGDPQISKAAHHYFSSIIEKKKKNVNQNL